MPKVKVTLAKPKIKEVKPLLPTKKEIPPKVVPAVVIPVPVAASPTEEKSLERTVAIDPTSITRARDITPLIRPTPVEREEPAPEPRALEPIVSESATQTSTATTEARPYAQRESQLYRTTGRTTYSATTSGSESKPEYHLDGDRERPSSNLPSLGVTRSERETRSQPLLTNPDLESRERAYGTKYSSRNYDSSEQDNRVRSRKKLPWEQ